MVFFNTKKEKINQKRNKKRGKSKKGRNQQQKKSPQKKSNKSSGGGKSKSNNKKSSQIFYNPALNKPKVILEDHENLVSIFRGHTGEIKGIGWHQSGKLLLSASNDKMVYLWGNPTQSQQTWEPLGKIKTEDNGEFSTLNTIITIDDEKEKKQQYDDNDDNNDDDHKGKGKGKNKRKKAFNPLKNYNDLSNSFIATTTGCWGLNSYSLTKPTKQQNNNTKYNYRQSSDSKDIQIELTSNIQTEFNKNMDPIRCVVVHPQLKFVAVSAKDNTKICFYDVAARKRQQQGKKIKVGIAPRNKQERKIALDNEDKPMKSVEGGQLANYQMNMSPDGNFLSIGAWNKDLKLWRINYKKPGKREAIQEMRFDSVEVLCEIPKAHTKSIICSTFSHDSRFMVSASKDGMVKIWGIADVDYVRGKKTFIDI